MKEFSLATVDSLCQNVLKAIAIYLIGKFVINLICKGVKKLLQKTKLDPAVHTFILSALKAVLCIEVALAIMDCFGVNAGSIRTVLAAAGAAVALALQSHLSNFAGGILILLTHPFKKGDYISGAGNEGTVEGIDLLYTTVTTPDNKVVTIPNGSLATSSITNCSAKDTRRVDWEIGVSYNSDVAYVEKVLTELVQKDARTLKEPAIFCAVSKYDNSAVVFVLRCWCKAEDYWSLKFDVQTQMKEALEKAGIKIPYPQLDVTIKK